MTDSHILQQVPMSTLCRINVGGPARFCAHIHNMDQLDKTVIVVGRGSNIVPADRPFNGILLLLQGNFATITWRPDDMFVEAGGGVPLIKLGSLLARRGHADYLYMGVIPGTVGGALYMNAGTRHEGCIADHCLCADIFDPDNLTVTTFDTQRLAFGPRTSSLQQTSLIILRARFRLSATTSQATAMRCLKTLHQQRKAKQPRERQTFGSTFRNPSGSTKTAGWYLDQVGMRGLRHGGAMVSPGHANWIINTGVATAQQVRWLIAEGQRRVHEQFGIALEKEVVYIP